MGYIVDNDAAVPTQDALNMKGHTMVVCMKTQEREVDTACDSTLMITRERLTLCMVLRS